MSKKFVFNEGSVDAIEFHDQLASSWSLRYKSGIFKQRLLLWQKILYKHVKSGQTWLDAGCGSGDLSAVLLKHDAKVIAIDASINMTKSVKLRKDIEISSVAVFNKDINDLSSLYNQNIDGIVCSSVLEYVSDISLPLIEFNNVLSPGGILIFSLPNKGINIRFFQSIIRDIFAIVGIRIFNYLEYSVTSKTKYVVKKVLEENSFNCLATYNFTPKSKFFIFNLFAPSMYIYIARKETN